MIDKNGMGVIGRALTPTIYCVPPRWRVYPHKVYWVGSNPMHATINPLIMKEKHWYKTDIYNCKTCNKKKEIKTKVFNEKEKGNNIIDKDCICDI